MKLILTLTWFIIAWVLVAVKYITVDTFALLMILIPMLHGIMLIYEKLNKK